MKVITFEITDTLVYVSLCVFADEQQEANVLPFPGLNSCCLSITVVIDRFYHSLLSFAPLLVHPLSRLTAPPSPSHFVTHLHYNFNFGFLLPTL